MTKTPVSLHDKTILVTGSPGFIGANLVLRLLKEMQGGTVISFDSMNDYYDPKLKEYRLTLIENAARKSTARHIFIKGNLADKTEIDAVFTRYQPAIVVNLAAQAGVRYSIDHPDAYIESNIIGFYNILEACRHSYDGGRTGVEHLVYASSSSVYGGNKKVPFSTEDKTDTPVSLYAATKKSNELLAHCYSKLYNIPSTGLRFFTVYGPAGRPDMFYYSATQKLVAGQTVQLFNYGNCKRDFTYIDDIVEGCGSCRERRNEGPAKTAFPCPLMQYITSAAAPRKTCLIFFGPFRKNWSLRAYCLPVMTSKATADWCPCNPAMCLLPLQTAGHWKKTMGSGHPFPYGKGWESLRNGIRSITNRENLRITALARQNQFSVCHFVNFITICQNPGLMGNDHHGFLPVHLIHSINDGCLRFQIQGRCGLVKHQNVRLPVQGPGNTDPLHLPS